MTRAVAVTFAPSGDGARCRSSKLHAHAAFVCVEERRDGLARGAFEDADEIGRAQHGGHPVRGELDAMLASTTNVVSPVVPILGADFIFSGHKVTTLPPAANQSRATS